MRKVIFALTAAFALVAFLSACGMGLEPAKTDTTRVSFTFAVSSTMDSAGVSPSSRAIIPDGGYLYVRMIGGPTAPNTKYLGPFQVTGRSPTVSIDKIPAGAYDYMFLLYTERLIHDEMIPIEGPDGTIIEISMGDFLSLPDELFLEIMEDDDDYEYETQPVPRNIGLLKNEIPFGDWDDLNDGPDEIELLFAGRASTGVIENPVIVEGTNNPFDVTMIPITPYWIPVWFTGIGNPMYLNELMEDLDGAGYESFKGFIGIEGIQEYVSLEYPDYTGNVRLTFSNESTTESMTVNRLSVYDGEGEHTATPSGSFPITMPAGGEYSLDVPMPEPDLDEIFFYLDVSGGTPAITITLDEGGTEIPELTTITGSLDLGDYAYNFDEITSVMFCTEDPTRWFSGTPEVGDSQYLVGSAELVQSTGPNEEAIYFFEDGYIFTGYDNTTVYMLITGYKYGLPVHYTTDGIPITLVGGDYRPGIMTPLMQYVVVYDWAGGLITYDGNIAELKLCYADSSVDVRDTLYSTVGIIEHEELEQVYAAIFILTPVEFNYIQLSLGENFNNLEFYAGSDIYKEDINANDAFFYVSVSPV